MILKRSLSAVLAVSMVLSSAGAQSISGVSGASNDAIDLVLQATMSKSPNEARQLLQRAKAKAEAEKLPADTLATINALISQASSKITLAYPANPLGGSAPTSFSLDPKTQTPTVTPPQAPATAIVAKPATSGGTIDQWELIARAIELNPDTHTIMREIGIGRIERDSSNLDTIIKTNTNQTIAVADKTNGAIDAALNDAGRFIKALRDTGLIKDWSQVNKALKAKHESIPIDVLAQTIVNNAVKQSAMQGLVKRVLAMPNIKVIEGFGVTAEAIATYALNADLVVRLADLYDMNLTEVQQDIVILTALPVSKLAIFGAKHLGPVKKTVRRIGELYGQARMNPDPKTMGRFYAAIFASPVMGGIAQRMGLGKVGSLKAAAEAAAAQKPAPVEAPIAAPAAAPAAAAVAAEPPVAPKGVVAGAMGRLEDAIAKIEGAAATAEGAAAKVEGAVAAAGNATEKVAKAPLSWKAQAAWLLAHTLVSGLDTYMTGLVAIEMFGYQKQKMRNVQTADFHAFLMQDKAKGFFKLLIATMNAGSTLPSVYNVKKSKDDKRVDFVMNVARSIKICSPEDYARFQELKAKGVYKTDPKSSVIASATDKAVKTLGRVQNYRDADYRLLRFQCDSTLGFGRYTQIAKEFMTFNAIPEWQVAQLRLASYDERMQMAELLMQAQFLYEEPNDAQNQFFQMTVSKILGLNRVEDINYFSRFYGFIRTRGGMEQNASSPTGWSIRTTAVDDPWAMSATYTIPGGPDLPAPPPAAAAAK